jgi:hypothetical protein
VCCLRRGKRASEEGYGEQSRIPDHIRESSQRLAWASLESTETELRSSGESWSETVWGAIIDPADVESKIEQLIRIVTESRIPTGR